ncbi:unnamed protein product, partial [Callosobruchus maculatus]
MNSMTVLTVFLEEASRLVVLLDGPMVSVYFSQHAVSGLYTDSSPTS